MKKNLHNILMLLTLIALCVVLHHALHANNNHSIRETAVEKELSPSSDNSIVPAVFIRIVQ